MVFAFQSSVSLMSNSCRSRSPRFVGHGVIPARASREGSSEWDVAAQSTGPAVGGVQTVHVHRPSSALVGADRKTARTASGEDPSPPVPELVHVSVQIDGALPAVTAVGGAEDAADMDV